MFVFAVVRVHIIYIDYTKEKGKCKRTNKRSRLGEEPIFNMDKRSMKNEPTPEARSQMDTNSLIIMLRSLYFTLTLDFIYTIFFKNIFLQPGHLQAESEAMKTRSRMPGDQQSI